MREAGFNRFEFFCFPPIYGANAQVVCTTSDVWLYPPNHLQNYTGRRNVYIMASQKFQQKKGRLENENN